MKKVTMVQYEKGDYIKVTSGYNKGKVGVVMSHPSPTHNVSYKIAGNTYDGDDEDDWNFEESQAKFLAPLTKKEYDAAIKAQKILEVPGLPVSVRFMRDNLVIDSNVITKANAKKIAEFILTNTKGKK